MDTTIEYIISSNGEISPITPQPGGVLGDDNTVTLSVDLSAITVSENEYIRIDIANGSGGFFSSEHLTVSNGKVTYRLPYEVTSAGGTAQAHLVIVEYDGGVNKIRYSFPMRIYFKDSTAGTAGYALYSKDLSGLMLKTKEEADRANECSAAAQSLMEESQRQANAATAAATAAEAAYSGAADSAVRAASSAENAANYAAAAASKADSAQSSAENAADSADDANRFSAAAQSLMEESQRQANAATAAATAAEAAYSSASDSAISAKSSADNAANYAAAAASKADSAQSSAENAAASEANIANAISAHNASSEAHGDIREKIGADILEHNTSSDAHSAKFTEINNQLSQMTPLTALSSAINAHNTDTKAHGINKIKTDIASIKNNYATKSYVNDCYPAIETTKASDVDTYELIIDDMAPINRNFILHGEPSTLFFVSGKNLFCNADNFAIGTSISPGETLTSELIFSCLPGGSYKFVVNEYPDTLIPGLQVILTFYDSSMSELGTTTITDDYNFYTYDYGTQFDSNAGLAGMNYIKIQLYNSNSDTSVDIESLMIVPSSISSNEYSEYQSYEFYEFDENGLFSEGSQSEIARFPVTYIKGISSSITANYNRDVGKVISELQTTIAALV